MKFKKDRIEKIVQVLEDLIFHDGQKIIEIKYGYGKEKDTTMEDFPLGTRWGGVDEHYRFKAKFQTPKEFYGSRIALKVITGQEKEWDAINPQFLLYCNGKRMQGVDVNHNFIILTDNGKEDEIFELDFYAYTGTIGNLVEFKLECFIFDNDVEQLYYNILVPYQSICLYDISDMNFINIVDYLTKAINILDLRVDFSHEFYESIKNANRFLEDEFYKKFCGNEKIVVKCVGHTHIDVAWLWRTSQTEEKTERSFSTVMTLFDQYPEYKFMSSQPQLYKYIKQNNPDLYAEIKTKIQEGRWETEGAMWVEADCNISSGESLIRQILFGKRFFKEEFNKDNRVLWLPDVFGYSAALPQILKKTGIDYFVTSKISWNEFNRVPYDTFMWKGMDGTEVLTQFITIRSDEDSSKRNDYYCTYNGKINPHHVLGGWDQYQQKDINTEILAPIGYGDGGGGTTRRDLEISRRMSYGIPGMPKTEFGSVRQYMEDLEARVIEDKRLPKWVGELYLEYHRGTYTSMAQNKRYNRKCEILLQDIEFLWSFATILNPHYPKEKINELWELVLLNQFHDILPGSSIKEVYDDSTKDYKYVENEGNLLIKTALEIISNQVKTDNDGLLLFNGTSYVRNDYYDYLGKKYFIEDLPSKGYKFVSNDSLDSQNTIQIRDRKVTTPYYNVTFDENYNLEEIIDKRTNRNVLAGKANVFQAFEDLPLLYDAWDINIYYQEKMWVIDNLQDVEIVDLGGGTGVKIKRNFLSSTIEQTIVFYEKSPRIDFETLIDWKEKHILLKTAFPVEVKSSKATFDIQYGNVERPNHWNTSWDKAKFEVCAHKWGDISQGEYGVSLLNDCKYGYEIKDNLIRLTLLKSATYPNPDADKCTHNFTYSLLPHQEDWKFSNTPKEAYFLNMPIIVSEVKENLNGTLNKSLSLFQMENDMENVIIEVVKKAENSSMLILRIYECFNRQENVKLSCFKNIINAWECSMEEEKLKELNIKDNSIEFTIKPYEIITIGVEI